MELDIHRIKSEMVQNGLNQSRLAERMGISRQLLSVWLNAENGKTTLNQIGQIATALGVNGKRLIVASDHNPAEIDHETG